MGLLLATAAAAQPSAADSALVERFLAANDFAEVQTQVDRVREQFIATAPSPEAAAMLAEIFAMDFGVMRDSIRAELLRDVRPDLLRHATAFLEGPVLPRVTEAARDVADLDPLALTALAHDPGDRPLADSTLAARYGRAVMAANQPEDVHTMVLTAMVELFPPALREQIDALGGPQAFAEMSRQAAGGEDAVAAMMTGIARVVLAEVAPDDIRAVTAYYESEAGLYVSHAAARAAMAAMLPRMIEAMRPMFESVGKAPDGAHPELATQSASDAAIRAVEAVQAAVDYPESALAEGVEGVVLLAVTLDADGTVLGAEVTDSPDSRLSTAALAAVDATAFPAPDWVTPEGTSPISFPVVFRLPQPHSGGEILEVAEVQPMLIGGMEGLQRRVVYPESARREGVQGQVVLQFVVDEEGRVVDPEVLRSPAPVLARAALEAVRGSRFTPGSHRGRPVKVRFAVPITFRLTDPAPDEPEILEIAAPDAYVVEPDVYEVADVAPKLLGGLAGLQRRVEYPEAARL